MQRKRHRNRQSNAVTSTLTRGARRARRLQAGPPHTRRRGLARLHSAYFSRAGHLATRYSLSFRRVILHLWQARWHQRQPLLLRHIAHLDDLVMAVACCGDCGRAWADLIETNERTLVRRCRDCRDELEATVLVRRFFANLRRDALTGRCALRDYAGTRPLRTWMAEAFHASRQRHRRAAFVLDPADSACGAPLQFTPTGAEG